MNQTQTIGPVNIGNPNEITVKLLSLKLLKMIDTKSEIIYLDLPLNDPQVRQPDIKKAKQFLNWSPIVSLDDGLKKTIEYFKK